MRLAIVGSVDLVENVEAAKIIRECIAKYKPTVVVSGGAVGIDQLAADIARSLNIEVKEYLPKGKGWPFYKERNKLIVHDCDRLIRITHDYARTYGSGWTRDYAAARGIPTENFVVQR